MLSTRSRAPAKGFPGLPGTLLDSCVHLFQRLPCAEGGSGRIVEL